MPGYALHPQNVSQNVSWLRDFAWVDHSHKNEDNRIASMNGVLVVNKPKGITSHDVVRYVRRMAKQREVGHLGTLDPMATGVLPLVLGRFTRLAQFYQQSEKEYEGTIVFGVETDTYDAEGEMVGWAKTPSFSLEELESALHDFRGEIMQIPPPFSAKKIAGVPAYKLAQRKEDVPLKAVRVVVRKLEVKEFKTVESGREIGLDVRFASVGGLAQLSFRAEVRSGTYIRSIAHDLGRRMDTGGFLVSLCRTRSEEFAIDKSFSLEQLEKATADGSLERCCVHARELLPRMPNVTANEDQMAKIRHGNAVNLSEFSGAELVKVFEINGELAAIAKRVAGTLFQPKVVLI